MNKYFVVGSDPEAFVRNSSGVLVSAIGLIPGTKESPHKTLHGSVQHDNILAEFNSIPSNSVEEFIENHRLIIHDLESILRPLDLHLDFIASALADDSLLSDPIARKAGCDPDFNAWLLQANTPANYDVTNVRAAGGHLHISFDQAEDDPEHINRLKFVKAMDFNIGVASVIFDEDQQRRKYYGSAGSFRPKDVNAGDPYNGVEYRTLSNFWLRSEEMMRYVYSRAKMVYNDLDYISKMAESVGDEIQQIINTGDRDKAEKFCQRMEINYEFCC